MKRIFPYLQIVAGTILAALAVNLFLLPNQLTSGGLSGLLLILHYLVGVPMGSTYFLANLPGLYLLYRIYGGKGLSRTLWGITSFSFFLEATAFLTHYAPTSNPLLASLYGGAVMGVGVGLAIMAGGATGGTDIIAQVVKYRTGMDVSRFFFVTDLFILGFGSIVISPEAILYGLLMTFVMSRVVQAVQEGLNTSRCLLIISEQPDEVSKRILDQIKRGVTQLTATGAYSGNPRPVLMCVVAPSEVIKVKRLVLDADPAAFVLITDAREVNGRGFTIDTDVRPLPFWRGI